MAVPCFYWAFQVCGDSDQTPCRSLLRNFQMGSRSDIRNRYDIRGEGIGDCLNSLLCRPCALTQERRELELEESSFR